MKNRYFWPHYQAVYVLLIWLVISCILGTIVTHGASEIGNHIPLYFFPLLIFAPIGLVLIPFFFTFVKVTDDEFICYKCGIIRCGFKLSDVTEWGIYVKDGGRYISNVLYITSIPISKLRNGKVINKKALKHGNRRKFIMLGYDDPKLLAFLREKFPLDKDFLYQKPDYVGVIDEDKTII